jgi:hypothetical protein
MYISKKFTPTQEKYHTTQREMLAIYWRLMIFRPYIEMQEFEVWTDHSALCHILNEPLSNSRETRYAMELSLLYEDFPIKHISGKKNVQADWLSRNALDGKDDDVEVEGLYYSKSWEHDSIAEMQAAEDVLEKGRRLSAIFGKIKIRQGKMSQLTTRSDTPTEREPHDPQRTDAEASRYMDRGDAEASLLVSDTPSSSAHKYDEAETLLYMKEALEATDRSKCAQRCITCIQHYVNDRNSKFSLSYYLTHMNSDKHRGCQPTQEIRSETCDYLRLTREETAENRIATGLAMITTLAALLPTINAADMRSCTSNIPNVRDEEKDHRLYQLIVKDRLLATKAAVLGEALEVVTHYIHHTEKVSHINDLNIGPAFNSLGITSRPLLSTFVHRNPRNTKEDEINFCAQVIILKHQVDQMRWEEIDVPQANETKTLLQMLIYDLLTQKGGQPNPESAADQSINPERREEIIHCFSGRAERQLWLHNSWGTREFFEHLWDDHHRGRLSNQITPKIIAGATSLPHETKYEQPNEGEISAETRKAIIKEQRRDQYLSPLRKLILTGKIPSDITAKT